ncbi:ATP synthase subunit I [Paenibacillus glycanilyticus]|uniref:ATP synthase subunit I n=1 Tax=Paenibacillus glycanilyticus TaxID=126569 RepID=UPI00203CF7A9|nr:ATP synthase subunit I [Paenibacillus glycanilyticus]MCM3628046.1 ATP synthase subunit I [Paenibacillus glycanilyticus]
MDDLSAHLKAVTRVVFLFMSLCCIGWALLPAYENWWGGLMIGGAASLINAYHLSWKVKRAGAIAVAQIKKRVNLGFFTRACVALLAVVIATKTYTFQLSAVVAGLFVAQLATLILGFLSRRKLMASNPTDERGENN